jgi:DNA anti-recombination protein RmuC
MGLQGMQIEENAKHLHASLAGMQKQMDHFADVFEKLGTHLKNAQQSYGEADKRFERAHNALEGMLGVGTADGDALPEDPQDPLALPEEASAKKSA